jgi:hypothetical protein
MKKILIFLFITLGCNAQRENTVFENTLPIKLKDICFNGVCLFDSVSSALKIFGKPNEIFTEKFIEPVDGREFIFNHYKYYSRNDKTKYFQFSEIISYKKGIVMDFKNIGNPPYIFGKEKKFYINQDTTELKNLVPSIYYKERERVEDYVKNRKKEITKKFEDIKQFKEFKTDSTFRKLKTSEYKKRVKEIEASGCCLSINLDVENNNYGYYGILLGYFEGKLTNMRIYKEL